MYHRYSLTAETRKSLIRRVRTVELYVCSAMLSARQTGERRGAVNEAAATRAFKRSFIHSIHLLGLLCERLGV